MTDERERVVFRKEFPGKPFAPNFIAVFPEDEANPGMIAYIAFNMREGRGPVFEPYSEMALGYYYGKTKPVKKDSDDAKKCLKAIEAYYDTKFRVMEKIR